jgi:hypothetical protein
VAQTQAGFLNGFKLHKIGYEIPPILAEQHRHWVLDAFLR